MSSFTIPEDIRMLSRQRAPRFYQILTTPPPDQIESGQVWSTRSILELPDGRRFQSDEPRLVVILDGGGSPSEPMDHVTAAPLSLSLQMATESDLVIAGEASPLGFDFMIEVWNETPVLKGHLRQFLGTLSDEPASVLHSLFAAQLIDEGGPAALVGWVGLGVMGEDDPRLAFQESEVEAVAYLARAATATLTLAIPVQESRREPLTLRELWRVFELPLTLGRLSDLPGEVAMAHAAGTVMDEDTFLVSQVGETEYFTLELLVDRYPPYEVYLVVHQVSSDLQSEG